MTWVLHLTVNYIVKYCKCKGYAVYFAGHTQRRQASRDDMDNTSGIALWCRRIGGPHSTQISDTDTGGQGTGYMIQISNTYTMRQFYTEYIMIQITRT